MAAGERDSVAAMSSVDATHNINNRRRRPPGGEPLDVPLERAGQRLVEVVDAEHEPPVGRREPTEVRQMRVAAQLHLEPASWRRGQIGRHRVGRAPEERERRHRHAPVADRHQLRHAGRRLLLEQVDRIGPIGRGLPLAVRGSRRHRSRGLASLGALGGCWVRDRLRRVVGWTPSSGPGPRRGRRRLLDVRHERERGADQRAGQDVAGRCTRV
jgi:hypothetical protein